MSWVLLCDHCKHTWTPARLVGPSGWVVLDASCPSCDSVDTTAQCKETGRAYPRTRGALGVR